MFVSTLLHGNETSGWDAVRELVRTTDDLSMLLLIGNIQAAAKSVRHLPSEHDFNRVWRQSKWQRMLKETLAQAKPWCGIDIHNNSGPNPHYSVVTNMSQESLSLAKLFSDILIFTEHTKDILSHAVSAYCPALTIEIGTVDDPMSSTRALEFLKLLNQMQCVPDHERNELDAFETLAIVKVEPKREEPNLRTFPRFHDDLVNRSFQTLRKGELFIECLPADWQVRVTTASGVDETPCFFNFEQDRVHLRREVVLSMFTPDPVLAMQDCVCYFLGKLDCHGN